MAARNSLQGSLFDESEEKLLKVKPEKASEEKTIVCNKTNK